MSYIGNFSILDRGDAPAQAVIERNARSLAQRVVDETKDELNKVMSRVHTIYGTMDTTEDLNPNMEYITDLAELETLLRDEIKKRQYQQQVTVFIVGYQDVCHQKLRLIQQVNEFFMENMKSVDDEDWFPTTPDIDLDEMTNAVEDSLNHAHELTNRLSELNKEMMEYMLALNEKKANSRGRKKIEKSLQQAKEEVNSLREKLLAFHNELQDREEKVQSLFKQLEVKNLDVQKFRTAAELGKQKLILTQKECDDQKKSHEETKANSKKLLDNQIQALQQSHKQEVDDLKKMYESKTKELQDASAEITSDDKIVNENPETGQSISGSSFKQESSPPAKASKTTGKISVAGSKQTSKAQGWAKTENKTGSHTHSTKPEKDVPETGVSDEGAEPMNVKSHAQTTKLPAKKAAVNVQEMNFDNAFDLFDEQAWVSVQDDHLKGRFAQYRQLSTQRLKELEDLLQVTTAKTHRKVASLKVQFQEHKNKWEAERMLIIQQVDQSLKFQTDAEKEADVAMTHLQDFITEQEKLEQEEEVKQPELLQPAALRTPADPQSPAAQELTENAATSVTPNQSSTATTATHETEQELQRLMQQTDDAKVQVMNARLGMCASGPPAVEMESSTLQMTESLSSNEGIKIEEKREEETRELSTLSRASLREHYKAKLEEAKIAAESRRSKSPGITLPMQLTLDDELMLDDDDDDDNAEEDGAIPSGMSVIIDEQSHKETSMHDVGTSPLTGFKRTSIDPVSLSTSPSQHSKSSRSSTSLVDHPLLKEYLQVNAGLVYFKDRMAKLFLEKDLMSAYQLISDLEILNFDHSKQTISQIEDLTKNILHVLEELNIIISNHLVYDREPNLSSLIVSSHEATEKGSSDLFSGGQSVAAHTMRDAPDSDTPPPRRLSGVRSRKSSNASDKQLIQQLQDQYKILKQQLHDDGRSHHDQLQRNTEVMKEMQDTINELRHELSSLEKLGVPLKTVINEKVSSPSPETSVMFTRLDSERNAKIMKKAVMEERLHPEKYKEAVSKMDEYVSLPGRRLANLVKKYIHHMRIKEIEEKVKNSSTMAEEVIHALDKMENLQTQRTRQWTERMSRMGMERLKLANLLMDTLDTIEQESGIFLIKPMYSYRGRDIKPDHICKLSRPVRHRHRRLAPYTEAGSSFVPAPTPNSNYRLVKFEDSSQQQLQQQAPAMATQVRATETRIQPEVDKVKVSGSSLAFNTEVPGTTWNIQTSHQTRDQQINAFNTPRILELDVKRMLIGQNNISSKLAFQPSDDRLINASQNTLRTYVTVQRPTASLGSEPLNSGLGRTPGIAAQKVRVSKIDQDIPASLTSTHPLPPITPIQGDELNDREILRPSSDASSYKDSHELPRKSAGIFHVPV